MSSFSYSTSFEDYINRINNMKVNPATTQTPQTPSVTAPVVNTEQKPDSTEFSTKKEYDGPKIGFFRLAFSRLTKEQVDAVNRSRRLPENAKISQYHSLKNNFFGITSGTRTIPEGYELRNSKFGFTKLVLVDSEGLFLKKKPGGDAETKALKKAEAKEAKKAAKEEAKAKKAAK